MSNAAAIQPGRRQREREDYQEERTRARTADATDQKIDELARTDTSRLSIVLPPKSMERLGKLKQLTEASSSVEVIRNALRLYEALIVEYEKGNKVQIVDRNGTPLSINIF